MSYSKEELSRYRTERAKESLEEAKILAISKHWNTTASRLYYACFYIASAYLVLNSFEASTHAGVKKIFNKELISTKRIGASKGLLYNKLFNLRQEADYRDFADVSQEEIEPMITEVEILIYEVIKLIETKEE
ncbi:MAG: HEPN domain-containing protein [Bacteroidota bacterium]